MVGALMTRPFYVEGRELGEEDAVRIYSLATRLDRIPGVYPPEDTGSSGLAVAKAAQQSGYISQYHHAFGLTSTLHALDQGPVILGIDWYEGFDSPEGKDAELVISGEVRGGHEIVLDLLDIEYGYVGGHNSWGRSWGNQGKFVMTFGTLGALLKQRGDVVVPVR